MGTLCYPTLKPIAERMAVRVVRAMLMITLHLLFFSFVMMMVIFDTLGDVAVDAEDTTAVDENLGEEVEHRVMNLSRRGHSEGDECHHYASCQEHDGGKLLEIRSPIV